MLPCYTARAPPRAQRGVSLWAHAAFGRGAHLLRVVAYALSSTCLGDRLPTVTCPITLSRSRSQSAVRKALHVPLDSTFFNGDNGEGMVYHLTEKNLMPFYQQVAKTTKLRVLVYNGDTEYATTDTPPIEPRALPT